MIFDLLHLEGRSLLKLPYDDRRELLESLELNGDSWQTVPVFHDSGADVLAASKAAGMEGVVAKRRNSLYLPGKRSPSWTKVKHIRAQEVVIGGWHAGNGRRAGRIGALLMGIPSEDGLQYVGQVGTGFTEKMLDDLGARLAKHARKTSPFAGELPSAVRREAHYVTPMLVGEVAFSERTTDGLLRHPAWRGLRPDKAVKDVRPE